MTEKETLTYAQVRYLSDTSCDTDYTFDTVKWAWEHLADKLDGYLECGLPDGVWGSDLPFYVTEDENKDGYVDSPYTADALEWMCQHIDDCAAFYEDEMEYMGECDNPFKNPTAYICGLYIRLVARLIERTEWFDENCDKHAVTVEDIKQLRKELRMDEETDND